MSDQTEQDPPVRKPNRAERRAMIYGNAAMGFPRGREPRSTTRVQRVTLRQNQDAPARVARARRIRERRAAARLEQAS
jgi:hypothetical protein